MTLKRTIIIFILILFSKLNASDLPDNEEKLIANAIALSLSQHQADNQASSDADADIGRALCKADVEPAVPPEIYDYSKIKFNELEVVLGIFNYFPQEVIGIESRSNFFKNLFNQFNLELAKFGTPAIPINSDVHVINSQFIKINKVMFPVLNSIWQCASSINLKDDMLILLSNTFKECITSLDPDNQANLKFCIDQYHQHVTTSSTHNDETEIDGIEVMWRLLNLVNLLGLEAKIRIMYGLIDNKTEGGGCYPGYNCRNTMQYFMLMNNVSQVYLSGT